MRQYLVDFSTLASANKGLGSYGVGNYLGESGTEGLTQLLDVARVVDLVVLSDSLVTSDRLSSYGDSAGVAQLATYMSLNRDTNHFARVAIPANALKLADEQIEQIERLLNLQIVYDFTYEIERDLTSDDYAFVESSAGYLGQLGIQLPDGGRERRERCFRYVVARTLQYLQTADEKRVPYVCHNFRAPIVRAVNPRLFKSSLDLYRECEQALKSWLSTTFGADRLEFSLPMFFVAVLREAKTSTDILNVAEQMRQSKEVRCIKEILSEITDESGAFHLLRYAELRRVAEEETKKFKRKFSPQREDVGKGPLGAEFSATPISVSAKVSIDALNLSKQAGRWLRELNDRRGIGIIFKTARDVFEVLSLETDIERVWHVKLTERHKELLSSLQQCCDPKPA
jgi:hypothetical protein